MVAAVDSVDKLQVANVSNYVSAYNYVPFNLSLNHLHYVMAGKFVV